MAGKTIQIDASVKMQVQKDAASFNRVKQELDDLTANLGKSLDKGIASDVGNISKLVNRLSVMKLNTENVDQYRQGISQLQDLYGSLTSKIEKVAQAEKEAKQAQAANLQSRIDELNKRIADKEEDLRKKAGNKNIFANEKDASGGYFTASGVGLKDKEGAKYNKIRRDVEKLRIELGKAEVEQQNFNNTLDKEPALVTKLKQVLESLGYTLVDLGKKEEDATFQMQQMASQEISNKIKNLAARFTSFYAVMRIGQRVLRSSINTYKELDASYTAIAAVSGKTRKQMWAMNETYNEMAQRLGTTTRQIAEASKLYFQQGRSESQVMELVEQTSVLATIAELDFAEATNFMTAAINGFNIDAKEAITVTDTWASLAASAAVNVNELATATSKVASLAGSVGMSMESTSAFLTKMIETTREAPFKYLKN